MKITRLLVLFVFFGMSCSAALADGVDPVFKLGPGGGSTDLTSDSFSFTVSESQAVAGFVTLDFINHTGAVIQELDLFAPGTTTPNPTFPTGVPLNFTCDPTGNPYFNNCNPQISTAGPTTISFFGMDATHTGIPTATAIFCGENFTEGPRNCTVTGGDPNSDFLIIVGVADLPTGWGSFDVAARMIPAAEPSTLLMVLAAGLGFLAVKRSGFAI